MSDKTSRRNFLINFGSGIASAVVFGVGGYFLGSSQSRILEKTVTQAAATATVTRTVTQVQTQTVNLTTTVRETVAARPTRLVIAWPFEMVTLNPYRFSRNIPVESPMATIYDRFLSQSRDLMQLPGVIESWEWGPEKTSLDLQVRQGIKFHDGTVLTAEDVAFSLETMKTPPNAYAGVWGVISKIEITGPRRVRLTLSRYDPSIIAWLGFLDAFVVPKHAWERLGPDNFGRNPVGSGPYKVKSFRPGILELERFEDYWRGAAPIKEVVFKEVLDPRSRAVEIEAGTSDYTLEVDINDFQRLSQNTALRAVSQLVTDVAILMIPTYYPETGDENVRLAMHYAIDKEAIVKNILNGHGRVVHTTEAPGYRAHDPTFTFEYNPSKASELLARSGYSRSNPVKITAATFRGSFPRDYEVMQAIVAMWAEVGIQAELEVITIAQHFELRNTGKMKHAHFYIWSNATGDPVNSVGYSQWPNSPFSTWRGLRAANLRDYSGLMAQATEVLNPVFLERDEEKRIAASRQASRWVVEKGLVIPLYQLAQLHVMKKEVKYDPWPQSWVLPYYMS
ncbi:MAG: ABC transporter substrate-binding protein, partial [Candidatus Caldarchaeum sp.]|nr:ABC transporter substrate-binding protein [Candidatus Caldarchaeum sp.]MDW8435849.1 ABC transporter substrate-binding protein [Candidatus Caldarchaeum sp.]